MNITKWLIEKSVIISILFDLETQISFLLLYRDMTCFWPFIVTVTVPVTPTVENRE